MELTELDGLSLAELFTLADGIGYKYLTEEEAAIAAMFNLEASDSDIDGDEFSEAFTLEQLVILQKQITKAIARKKAAQGKKWIGGEGF